MIAGTYTRDRRFPLLRTECQFRSRMYLWILLCNVNQPKVVDFCKEHSPFLPQPAFLHEPFVQAYHEQYAPISNSINPSFGLIPHPGSYNCIRKRPIRGFCGYIVFVLEAEYKAQRVAYLQADWGMRTFSASMGLTILSIRYEWIRGVAILNTRATKLFPAEPTAQNCLWNSQSYSKYLNRISKQHGDLLLPWVYQLSRRVYELSLWVYMYQLSPRVYCLATPVSL